MASSDDTAVSSFEKGVAGLLAGATPDVCGLKPKSSSRGTVVLAGLAPFMNGRCRDRKYMSSFPGGAFLADIADEAERRGFHVMTIDQFMTSEDWPTPALLVSDTGLGIGECQGRAIPAVCWCLESPVIAFRFFHALRRRSRKFRHAFLWGGARERVGAATIFHPLLWAHEFSQQRNGPPWQARRFAVMVTANKQPFPLFWRPSSFRIHRLFRWIIGILVNAISTIWIRSTDAWMRSSLASARRKAIVAFGQSFEFDLYGAGWDRLPQAGNFALAAVVRRCYRGAIPPGVVPKLETISGYRFCLCFENAVFPGYVTEKILDAFLADTIPVYLGAPDITRYVPPDAFIDARKFSSWHDLAAYLSGLTDSQTQALREAAAHFVRSPDFSQFQSATTAIRIVDAIDAVRNDT